AAQPTWVLALVSDPFHSARWIASLDWLHRQNRARVELACARRRQPGAKRILSNVRRHHRDGPLVWPFVQQCADRQDRYTHRVPKRHALPASPAGKKGRL